MVVIIGGPKNRAYLAIVIGSQHENRIAWPEFFRHFSTPYKEYRRFRQDRVWQPGCILYGYPSTIFGGNMKVSVLKLFLIIALASVPVFAQEGGIPSQQPGSLSWGWMMTLGLIAGVVLGLILRPRRITHVDEKIRRDRAA
jgi:hypothetical protein